MKRIQHRKSNTAPVQDDTQQESDQAIEQPARPVTMPHALRELCPRTIAQQQACG